MGAVHQDASTKISLRAMVECVEVAGKKIALFISTGPSLPSTTPYAPRGPLSEARCRVRRQVPVHGPSTTSRPVSAARRPRGVASYAVRVRE